MNSGAIQCSVLVVVGTRCRPFKKYPFVLSTHTYFGMADVCQATLRFWPPKSTLQIFAFFAQIGDRDRALGSSLESSTDQGGLCDLSSFMCSTLAHQYQAQNRKKDGGCVICHAPCILIVLFSGISRSTLESSTKPGGLCGFSFSMHFNLAHQGQVWNQAQNKGSSIFFWSMYSTLAHQYQAWNEA